MISVEALTLMILCLLPLSCGTSAVEESGKPAQTTIITLPADTNSKTSEAITQTQASKSQTESALQSKRVAESTGKGSADSPKNVVALSDSTLEIDGDSTLRKYSSKATTMAVRVKLDPAPKNPEDVINDKLSEFVLVIPISGMKSGNGTLDEHLSDALNAKAFADIRGVVKSYTIKTKNPDGTYEVTASVDLTIAGTTKTVPVSATLSIQGKNLKIQGEKELLMTDFNVKPPTLMLGAIKAANPITIKFNILLGLV
jgi:hypothetical protein